MANKWKNIDVSSIMSVITSPISNDGEYIYFSCGFDDIFFGIKKTRRYDIAGNFTELTDIPATGRWQNVSHCVNISGSEKVIYSGLGVTVFPTVYYDDWFEYNILNNSWTQKTSIPNARARAVSGVINNRIYVGMGYDSTWRKDWWMYNQEDDTWTQKSDFIDTNGLILTTSFTFGDDCYVGGGQNYYGWPVAWYKYNSVEDSWVQLGDGPTGRSDGVYFTIGNMGYYGLGSRGGGLPSESDNQLWQYNPRGDKWVRMANLPIPAANGAKMAYIGKTAYLIEGHDRILYEWDGPPLPAYRFIHSKKRIHDRRGSIRENV